MPSIVDGVKVTDELIMASRICDSVLVTGSNRGIGLELVRQLVDSPTPPVQIFAGCRDPNGQRSQVRNHANTIQKSLTCLHEYIW